MSASLQPSPLPQGPDVLGELLHSLSQPLTSLRCSLELSIDEDAEKQQKSVSVALQQTDNVIGMIQLMREYLHAAEAASEIRATALAPALRSITEELSSIAAVRGIGLRLVGTCAATVPVPESRLRLALQYLIAWMIEAQPTGGKVLLLLGEGPGGAMLRVEGECGYAAPARSTSTSASTLRRVRLSIASRVLEGAGASLVLGDGDGSVAGFVLRVPHRIPHPAQ
jgi:signal transduction histidine kinase